MYKSWLFEAQRDYVFSSYHRILSLICTLWLSNLIKSMLMPRFSSSEEDRLYVSKALHFHVPLCLFVANVILSMSLVNCFSLTFLETDEVVNLCKICHQAWVPQTSLFGIVCSLCTTLITEVLGKQLRVNISDNNFKWRFHNSFIIFEFIKTKSQILVSSLNTKNVHENLVACN